MIKIRYLLGCAATVLIASPALAAPYCVQLTGLPLQCLYVDPQSCQAEANRQGGRCAGNPAEFQFQSQQAPVGAAQFCVVESGNITSCIYPDRVSCVEEASRRRGACIAATPLPDAPTPVDPFDLKRPY